MSIPLSHHAAALGFVVADIVLRALRTRTLLPVPLVRAAAINTCGDAVAAITPGRIGGDPVRYLGFRRLNAERSSIFALFGLEIAADAVAMVVLGVLLSLAFRPAALELVAAARDLLNKRGLGMVVVATLALAIGSAVLTRRWLPKAAEMVSVSLRDAWRCARLHSPGVLLLTVALTLLSLVARGAILPALLAGTPGLGWGTLLMGSAVLLYGQLLAPTPAGLGAVELGAVASLAGHLPLHSLPALLLIWRTYTLALGGLAGGALLARAAIPASELAPVTFR